MELVRKFIADQEGQVFILRGYAGTGKTTLIRLITEYIESQSLEARVMASTGRAAKILRSKLPAHTVSTIHRAIYRFDHLEINESEGELKYIYPLGENERHTLCVVDEASMISSRETKDELFQFGSGVVLDDLLTYARVRSGGKILFAGDPMQLPPVGDHHSAALDKCFFERLGLKVYTCELTDIVRQDKDSAILANAAMIRELIGKTERNTLILRKRENEVMDINALDISKRYCEDPGEKAAIISYTNQQVADYNTDIRARLFPGADRPVSGDRLLVVCNSYFQQLELLNGDIITVVEASDATISQSALVWSEVGGKKIQRKITLEFREISFQLPDGNIARRYIIDSLLRKRAGSLTIEERKALYINLVMRMREEKGLKDRRAEEFAIAMRNDPFYNALQVKYGYAFTCHKAQGGEWDTVYVDFASRTGLDTDSLRWKYTAITRARKRLFCVNHPDITPISTLKVAPIGKTGKIPNTALAFEQAEETPFHPLSAPPAVKWKYRSVVRNMEGTPYSVVKVTSKPWREIYEVNTPTGTTRVDALYNAAGLFKYETADPDPELLAFFRNEENIRYRIDYQPSLESLMVLHRRMISLCDECDIRLTNVIEERYQLIYYMRTSGDFASLTFYFNGKGTITHAVPLSILGESDEKLARLIGNLI